ncbi:calcium-binding protein PBP1-like [Durio zibethinus]|uniref:Calcium-binding protein PBP1-like n=1 Tax=Durio zibethinus TaxID=66656 RepID=A0A6P6BJT9_DURZI|nr:calcium-binding protein PBP1-like [Durio zibethinus]
MASQNGVVFEDFFPAMVEKLGAEGFMKELCNGFQLLVDGDKGVITFESLKRNSALLGLQDMSDEEAICMLREGDLDGDGALNEMEFCTLMLRLSPELMNSSTKLLVEAIVNF